jgi:hypothetical protein
MALLCVFFFVSHEYLSRWGATDVEAVREFPGDNIGASRGKETRAITIHAPAREVWPWVAQLGRGRGGFYSWTVLEDQMSASMPTIDRVRLHRPGEALVFATAGANGEDNGTWAFIIEPIDEHSARLIVRDRTFGESSMVEGAVRALVFDPIHFAMERKTMDAIKRRAEGGGATPSRDRAEVVGWTLTGAAFAVAAILSLLRRTAAPGLTMLFLTGLALQALTFLQPGAVLSVAIGTVMLVALALGPRVWRPRTQQRSEAPTAATTS